MRCCFKAGYRSKVFTFRAMPYRGVCRTFFFFYAMFPLLARILNGRFKWLFASIIFIVYFSVLFLINEEHLHAFVYISPVFRLTDFIIGMLLFKFVKYLRLVFKCFKISELTKSSLELVTIFVTAVFVFYYHDLDARFTLASWYWIPTTLMIVVFSIFENGGIISKLLTVKPLVQLGEASFTFYMIHTLAITVLGRLLMVTEIEVPVWLCLISYIIIISLSALIIHRYIEIPISRKLSSLLLK